MIERLEQMLEDREYQLAEYLEAINYVTGLRLIIFNLKVSQYNTE